MKYILITILAVVFLSCLFGFLVVTAMDSKEIQECKQWALDAGQYKEFFITQWMKDQCDSHKIVVNAPVK